MGYEIFHGDAKARLSELRSESVQCIVTSPPYWDQRDYGVEGQIGDEPTPDEYIQRLVDVFHEAYRVLRKDGTLWLNLGDTYASGKRGRADSGTGGRFGGPKLQTRSRTPPAGFKDRDLMLIPARVAMALQVNGWYLRSDIIWHKTNVMPEGAQYSRPTRSHEHIFLLSRSKTYYYNHEAIKEPCEVRGGLKNARDVWSLPTGSFKGAHFAVFPPALPERCILAGTRPGDVVLDPFMGTGTTGIVAGRHGRDFIGIELNQEYLQIASGRLLEDWMGLPV